MAFIEQLVATRQQALDLFLTNGGQKKEYVCLGSEAAPFIRDAALLTHPLYSTCILNNAKARDQSLEINLAVHYGRNLAVDETEIETPTSYSTRQNKYGVSSIQFDREGVLFAVGGSSGTVRVYDFDEVYARMQIRPRDVPALRPVVHFDTRRDISHIAWSHLRPNDIAVAYLFRPEVHVFDLSEIDDSTGGGGEETPTRVLETDSKGGSGHNVLLFWHSEKNEAAPTSTVHGMNSGNRNLPVQGGCGNASNHRRVSEGIIAGSVTGYIRFWNTSTTATMRSNSKKFVWNLLADPHRTSVTASPVVALLHVTSSETDAASPLLLAATAQGVVTVWDLSNLRQGSFGSMQPEPKCLRRVDFGPQLMSYGGVTLIGACCTRPAMCSACLSSTSGSVQKRANQVAEWSPQNVQVVRSTPVPSNVQAPTKGPAASSDSGKAATATTRGGVAVNIVLTLSTGSVYRADLTAETAVLLRTGNGSTGLVTHPAETKKVAAVINDPRLGIVVSYEELRREGSLNSVIGTTGIVDGAQRSVLPAVIPAWCPASSHSGRTVGDGDDDAQSDLYISLAQCGLSDHAGGADLVLLAEPSENTAGTRLISLAVGTAPVQPVYPFVHSLGGVCSISGKDSDAWSGVSRSNMRRTGEISTTLPGIILSAQPGEFEVTTTHDQQTYLCAEVAAAASYSKTSDVRFDWSYPRELLCGAQDVEDAPAVLGSDGLPHTSTTSSNTIAQVSRHRLVLEQPYVGPEVRRGHPRVLLQAALVPSGRTANTAAPLSGAVRSASDSRTGNQLTSSTVADHLTALCAHPTYPFLIAGTRSDRVSVLNPVNYRLPPQETEVAPRVEGVSLVSLEDEERRLAQRAGGGRAVQSWRRVLPRREGDDAFDPSLDASVPVDEDAQAAETETLRTLLPRSFSVEEDISPDIENAEPLVQMDDVGLPSASCDVTADLTAEIVARPVTSMADDTELEIAPGTSVTVVDEPEPHVSSAGDLARQSCSVAASDRLVAAGKRSVDAAAFAGQNKSNKIQATSSSSAGKLVLERTQPRSVAASSCVSESRAQLPLFTSSRPHTSKPSASSDTLNKKPVGKALNPFAVAVAPAQEPKRNLLSTLARAKENVPAMVAAAPPAKAPPVLSTAAASSAKSAPLTRPTGASNAANTLNITNFFAVKK